ncbi:MAG: hypothetical protein EBS53_06265 [Bacteroidetes bacterium]|nr:hypothetical protein [Bacteroidota bacterium]
MKSDFKARFAQTTEPRPLIVKLRFQSMEKITQPWPQSFTPRLRSSGSWGLTELICLKCIAFFRPLSFLGLTFLTSTGFRDGMRRDFVRRFVFNVKYSW